MRKLRGASAKGSSGAGDGPACRRGGHGPGWACCPRGGGPGGETHGAAAQACRAGPCAAVAALAFVLYLFFDVSCVWLVLMGVVSGIALCEFYERRGGNGHGAA